MLIFTDANANANANYPIAKDWVSRPCGQLLFTDAWVLSGKTQIQTKIGEHA